MNLLDIIDPIKLFIDSDPLSILRFYLIHKPLKIALSKGKILSILPKIYVIHIFNVSGDGKKEKKATYKQRHFFYLTGIKTIMKTSTKQDSSSLSSLGFHKKEI